MGGFISCSDKKDLNKEGSVLKDITGCHQRAEAKIYFFILVILFVGNSGLRTSL